MESTLPQDQGVYGQKERADFFKREGLTVPKGTGATVDDLGVLRSVCMVVQGSLQYA